MTEGQEQPQLPQGAAELGALMLQAGCEVVFAMTASGAAVLMVGDGVELPSIAGTLRETADAIEQPDGLKLLGRTEVQVPDTEPVGEGS